MYKYSYDKRLLVEDSQRVSAGVFVRNCLIESGKTIQNIDLSKKEIVLDLINKIEQEASINLTQQKGGEEESTSPNKVQLACTRSNLGRGFIFWFICNLCGKRVRYLYFPPSSSVLACRKCHGLQYAKQNES